MMTPLGKGPPALNREALSKTYSHAPLLRTRPEAKRTRDKDDGPVRIRSPVHASACPPVGANYRRLVTADAMGMARERDRTEVDVDGTGSKNGDKHSEIPRCSQVRG